MAIDLITIVYVLILAVFLILGFKGGIMKVLVKVLKSFVSTILSTFLSVPMTKLIMTSKLGDNLIAKNAAMLTEKGEPFTLIYNAETKEQVLSNLKIADIIKKPLMQLIDKFIPETGESVTVAEAVAPVIVRYAVMGVCFILAFITLRLLCIFLNEWIERHLGNHPFLNTVDKLLGMALYGIVGIALVLLISYAISFIVPLDNSFSKWLMSQLRLGEDTLTLSKFLYNHNFLASIFASVLKL